MTVRSLRRPAPDSDILQAALDASGVVGTWSYDPAAGRIALSAPAARFLGFVPRSMEDGMALPSFVAGLHAADQARVEGAILAAAEGGDSIDLAFRRRGSESRVLLRGRMVCDSAGRSAMGCGIVLDVTPDRDQEAQDQGLVNRIADHVIALRDLSGRLGNPGLSGLVDRLMMEVGRELARHLQRAGEGRRH